MSETTTFFQWKAGNPKEAVLQKMNLLIAVDRLYVRFFQRRNPLPLPRCSIKGTVLSFSKELWAEHFEWRTHSLPCLPDTDRPSPPSSTGAAWAAAVVLLCRLVQQNPVLVPLHLDFLILICVDNIWLQGFVKRKYNLHLSEAGAGGKSVGFLLLEPRKDHNLHTKPYWATGIRIRN